MPLSDRAALAKDLGAGDRAPVMQHRHFAFIANTVADLPPEIRKTVANLFEQRLRRTNPNFNSWRFLKASGLETIEYETILRDQESIA